MSVSDKNYAVCLCTEQGFFPLYVWTHYKCLSSDFFIITVCHWCYTCKISFVLTCRILCIGHLTSTWSSQSSLGRVCRNHWQTTDDCAYWVKSKSAQFFISSFSFAWTRVSNKNDVPVIQLKYTLYKKSRTKLLQHFRIFQTPIPRVGREGWENSRKLLEFSEPLSCLDEAM